MVIEFSHNSMTVGIYHSWVQMVPINYLTRHKTTVALKETHLIWTSYHTQTLLSIRLMICFCLFLFIQVINGLMEREDWQEAIQTPLGILPGGSGNALAASVHHYSQWVSPLMSHLNAWTKSAGEQPHSALKKERFISFRCNYAKGWLGTSILRREERQRSKNWNCFAVQQTSFQAADNSQRNDVMGLKTSTLWAIIFQNTAVEPVVVQVFISICWLAVGTTSIKKTIQYLSPWGVYLCCPTGCRCGQNWKITVVMCPNYFHRNSYWKLVGYYSLLNQYH